MNSTSIFFAGNQKVNNQLVGKIIVNGQETNQICNIDEVLNSITSALQNGAGSLNCSHNGAFYLFEFRNNDNLIKISFNKLEEQFYKVYIDKLKSLLSNEKSDNRIIVTLLNNGKDQAEKEENGNKQMINSLEITNYLLEQTKLGNLNSIVTSNDFDKIIYHLELNNQIIYDIVIPSNAIEFQEHIISKLNNIKQIHQELNMPKTAIDEKNNTEIPVTENLPSSSAEVSTSVNSNILQKPKDAENFFMNLNKKEESGPQTNPFDIFKLTQDKPIENNKLESQVTYKNNKYISKMKRLVLMTFITPHKCIFQNKNKNISHR